VASALVVVLAGLLSSCAGSESAVGTEPQAGPREIGATAKIIAALWEPARSFRAESVNIWQEKLDSGLSDDVWLRRAQSRLPAMSRAGAELTSRAYALPDGTLVGLEAEFFADLYADQLADMQLYLAGFREDDQDKIDAGVAGWDADEADMGLTDLVTSIAPLEDEAPILRALERVSPRTAREYRVALIAG
jgi:hypothetical protein